MVADTETEAINCSKVSTVIVVPCLLIGLFVFLIRLTVVLTCWAHNFLKSVSFKSIDDFLTSERVVATFSVNFIANNKQGFTMSFKCSSNNIQEVLLRIPVKAYSFTVSITKVLCAFGKKLNFKPNFIADTLIDHY